MKKVCLVCGFFLLLGSSAVADTVYKWTDANGKVHYGDQAEAARNNAAKTVIKAPPPPASVAPESVPPAVASRADSGGTQPAADSGKVQTCLAMARAMANDTDMNPAKIRADSKNLLDLCPATAYECVTYVQRPEANNCTAVPMRPGGSIVSNRTYTR